MVANGRRLQQHGIAYLDATIAGSSQLVRDGMAVVLVGGDASVYQSHRDLWDVLFARHFYLGATGSGAKMKLAVNLVIGLHRAVLAEGLAFAKSMDLDLEQVLQVFRETPAYSAMMDTKGMKMIRGDFAPQARLAQHLKDVELILQQAGRGDAELPLSHLHRQLLQQLVQQGHGGLDNSAIAKAFDI